MRQLKSLRLEEALANLICCDTFTPYGVRRVTSPSKIRVIDYIKVKIVPFIINFDGPLDKHRFK